MSTHNPKELTRSYCHWYGHPSTRNWLDAKRETRTVWNFWPGPVCNNSSGRPGPETQPVLLGSPLCTTSPLWPLSWSPTVSSVQRFSHVTCLPWVTSQSLISMCNLSVDCVHILSSHHLWLFKRYLPIYHSNCENIFLSFLFPPVIYCLCSSVFCCISLPLPH